jgi:hypothetical protein
MRVPAIAAITVPVVIAAPRATQVQGQRSRAMAFNVAPIKPSNPGSTNPLSAFSMISSSSADAKLDR